MAEVKVRVSAETKAAEDALRRAQQLADSLGKKQATIKIKAEGLDGLARQIKVVENETAKLAMSADTFRALSSGAITAKQAMEDMGTRVNRVNTEMQSFIDRATGVERETSQITAKTSMFGKMSDDAFAKYSSGAMSAAEATETLDRRTNNFLDTLQKRFTAANLAASAMTFAILKLRQSVRSAVDDLKEMDKQLTTIKMVTGESDAYISSLKDRAFSGASEMGREATDYLAAAERFARAGYRENIDDLTRLSLVTQNVGGVTEETASKFLLAADAAWKFGGSEEKLMAVLDAATAVSDQHATDVEKIATAITVAGPAMAQAGEDYQSFIAMVGTSTAMTQRSGEEIARGLRTIMMRIRQVKGELDDGEVINAEDISKAAGALDSVGISVLDANKELRSMSDILGELSGKWATLSSTKQSELIDALAGKLRGNVLVSVLENWGTYKQMLDEIEESSGNALKKNAIYTQSWEAAVKGLNTAWAKFMDDSKASDFAKELVKGLTSVISTIGNVKTALTMLATAFVALKATKINDWFKNISTVISSGDGLKGALSGLAGFITSPAGIITAVGTLISVMSMVKTKMEEARKATIDYSNSAIDAAIAAGELSQQELLSMEAKVKAGAEAAEKGLKNAIGQTMFGNEQKYADAVQALLQEGFGDAEMFESIFTFNPNEVVRAYKALLPAMEKMHKDGKQESAQYKSLEKLVADKEFAQAVNNYIEQKEALDAVTEAVNGNEEALQRLLNKKKEEIDTTEDSTNATQQQQQAIEKVTNAFEKQRTKISEVAKAIKEEKDDAVNSLVDIYKAAMEAADKGLYGSNAFRKGGGLFFSEEGLTQIKEEGKTSAREYLDAYFSEIESGNYSAAAANFFEKITGGSNEIKAKNGEVLASMKDLGDAFQWTFDKGNRSMEEYLQSLQNNTGISKTFWASMIESLGMYSDELSEWTERDGEAKTEVDVDTTEAEEKLEKWVKLLDEVPTEIQTELKIVYDEKGLEAAEEYLKEEAARQAENAEQDRKAAQVEAEREAAANAYARGYMWSGYAESAAAEQQAKAAAEAAAKAWDELASETTPIHVLVPTPEEAKAAGEESGAAFASGFSATPPEAIIDDAVAKSQIAELVKTETKTITVNVATSGGYSGGGSSGGFNVLREEGSRGILGRMGFASGKRNSYSGIALVNDEYPADGSKPELIISPSKGTAYIANGGKPSLVNLASDDIVLTANETKSAIGVPGFPIGKNNMNVMADGGGSKTSVTAITSKTPKTGSNNVSVASAASKEEADPTENWNQLKKLIDYMMDQEKEILDDKLAILDKQLAELEAARKSQKNIDELAQKLVKVDEAQLDLLKAQTERTVRYYNESTNQWEWMADQGVLAEAENAYNTALKDLNDFLVDLNFEEQKANIKAQKDALQEAYDTYKKGWDTIIESIEAPTGDLAALFAELKVNGTDAMKSQAQNIETLLGALETGFYTSIDDAALANAESLAKTYAMLEKSSSDSQAIAQEAINNILGRSQQVSTDITGAAQLALSNMSTISSENVTAIMGEAQKALNSMATETEYTGEGMAKTLSDATVNITGAAADAIKDIVQGANDFLNSVKQAEAQKTADKKSKKETTKKSSGGSQKKAETGGTTSGNASTTKAADLKNLGAKASADIGSLSTLGAGVLAETKGMGKTNGIAGKAAASSLGGGGLANKAMDRSVTDKLANSLRTSVTNNNGGNTYINGVSVGSSQADAPFSSVLSKIKLQTNSVR